MKSNVIEENYIYFTNLDTVKCKEFEYSNNRFFINMRNLINNDPHKYNVKHDKENDQYIIVYDGKSYKTKYGKKDLDSNCEDENVLEILNKLVDITNIQIDLEKEELDKEKHDEKEHEKVVNSAKLGILVSNEEKTAKIDLINNDYKDNKFHFWKGVWEKIVNLNVGDVHSSHPLISVVSGGVVVIVCIVLAASLGVDLYGFIGLGIFSILSIDAFSVIPAVNNCEEGYRGLCASLLSLLLLPINLGMNLVKKLRNVFKHRKEISNIKKTIFKTEKKVNLSRNKVNIDELSKFLSNQGRELLNNSPTDLTKTIESINELKDKILTIKDKNKSTKLAKELYDIIMYYVEANNNVKDKNKISNNLFNQIGDLNKRVDDELNKENESNNNYDSLIENIEHQKSFGAR
jgi:hypothetical protein